MTQVGVRQGVQPSSSNRSISVKSTRTGLPESDARPRCQTSRTGVRFGGGWSGALAVCANRTGDRLTSLLLPIFQTISEVFLAAFLALDVVSMWLPRIGTSLLTGSEQKDPKQDPYAKNLPFKEQVRWWIRENTRGLNWLNFAEETKREFATGPGLLIIPGVAFALARRLMVAQSAVKLDHKELNGLTHGFIEHLKQSPLGNIEGKIKPDDFKAELTKYIADCFKDPGLKATLLTDKGMAKTYGQALDAWSKKFVDAAFGVIDPEYQGNPKEYAQFLQDELYQQLREYNLTYRLKPHDITYLHQGVEQKKAPEAIKNLLPRSDSAWIGYNQGKYPAFDGVEQVSPKPIKQFLNNLKQWIDLPKSVWGQKTVNGTGVLQGTLPELLESGLKKLVTQKFVLATGVLVSSAYYMSRLAFWAQSHDSYQATRTLKQNPVSSGGRPQPATVSGSGAAINRHGLASAFPAFPTVPMTPMAAQSFASAPAFAGEQSERTDR